MFDYLMVNKIVLLYLPQTIEEAGPLALDRIVNLPAGGIRL